MPTFAVYPASPKLSPCTVMLPDPVTPAFARRIPLNAPASPENAVLTLPTLIPLVKCMRKLRINPCPPWHRTDVSDSHPVCSHPVLIIRTWPVYPASPTLEPCTVKLADPVAARFILIMLLTALVAIDNPAVTLPPRSPTVIANRWVPIKPCPP